VSIGGFHFTRQPIALVEAIASQGTKGLTHVHWGGSLGLEILLEASAVDHVIFCFSSLEIFGTAPSFRRALESGSVTFEEYTALELHQALLAAEMNLEALPLQDPTGSWRAMLPEPGVRDSPTIEIDVVLLHASRADELGNVEIPGAQGLDRLLALAGRKVLVTVEEVVPAGALTDRASVIPRHFIDAIAVHSGAAWPTSCVPNYGTDYTEILGRVRRGTLTGANSTSEGVGTLAETAPRVDWRSQPFPSREPIRHQAADQIVAWLHRRIRNNSICSVGSASSLATVAYLAAKTSVAPRMSLLTHNGGYLDVGSRFASISFGESADFQSAAVYCGGDDSYRWYYQQGRVTEEVVGAAQIDQRGQTNNGWITSDGSGRRLRLPGQGGMADVANMHRNFVLYAPRQSARQLVTEVEWISAARGIHDNDLRASLGYGPGSVSLITDLAVFVYDEHLGHLVVESIHEGVSADQLRAAVEFAIDIPADLRVTPAPTPDELKAIDRVDPFGLRVLEFLPARDRLDAIERVLADEAMFLKELVA